MIHKIATFTLRIDRLSLDKLGYIAKYEDRSKNSELLKMIRARIAEFEKTNGRIELDREY